MPACRSCGAGASDAVSGHAPHAAYVVLAVGLVAFALFSNIVSSDDNDAVETAKACAEARDAGATSEELTATVCDAARSNDKEPTEPSPTATEVRVTLAAQLTAVLAECVSRASPAGEESDERPIADTECTGLRQAIAGLLTD